MTRILDLGTRIELVSMYPHFHDISIALYERKLENGDFEFQVHSYAGKEGVNECLDYVISAMVILGGMIRSDNPEQKIVHFHSGLQHRKACKRIFLEACKIALGTEIEPKKLSTFDKKTERQITLEYLGNGNYQVNADGDETGRNRRISAIAGGFVKLAEMEYIDRNNTGITFDCGNEHASLIGLLLGRALNVRAAIREDDDSAGRGMLAAPSAQQ